MSSIAIFCHANKWKIKIHTKIKFSSSILEEDSVWHPFYIFLYLIEKR